MQTALDEMHCTSIVLLCISVYSTAYFSTPPSNDARTFLHITFYVYALECVFSVLCCRISGCAVNILPLSLVFCLYVVGVSGCFFFQLQFTQSREEKNRQKKRPYFSTTTQIAEIKITKHIWKLKHSSNAIFSVYFLGTRFGCYWLFSAYDVRVGLWCCISYL